MIIVGIDIGKNNHEATLIDIQGNIIGKSIRFSNSHQGTNKLLKYIRENNPSNDEIIFGLEATGHYWLALYSRLLSEGFKINVINPIQSDSFRNLYIRKTKNDSKDSFIIAEVIRFGRFTSTKLSDEKILALRQLCRYRSYMVDQISDLKRKVISILDQIFPEYSKLFSDVFGKTSKELLLNHTTPEEIANLNTDYLTELLLKLSKGRLGFEKATQIKETAANSFGIKIATDAFTFQIKQLLEQIKFMETQLKELEKNIADNFQTFNSPLTSIPCIGPVLGAIILSEIGDFSRFSNGAKLVAYAGIDPTVRQSGEFNGIHNRMSKRGSPYLRRAIWMAATVAAFKDPVLNNYYNKKRSEGKHHLTAIGAVARKLTYIIYAVMRDNKEYTPMA
ncbi:IS110 family transposase [Caminicella sporogenes]|nr:IS110 family transposase [Caminicella sporogenes]WIF95188.1 IS110 family transposase [Caminicella sporogenes]